MPSVIKPLLWGTDDPRFTLLDSKAARELRGTSSNPAVDYFCPGIPVISTTAALFQWSVGSPVVTTNVNFTDYSILRVGDRIGYTKNGPFYQIYSIDADKVTLTTNSAVTRANARGFIDISHFRITHPRDIVISYEQVRLDSGSLVVTLIDGTIIDRREGFRPTITFDWVYLGSMEVNKIIHAVNWCSTTGGYIEVEPHLDVPLKWRMIPQAPSFAYTGDLYVGMDVQLTFVGADVIKNIPNISPASTFFPMILGS